MKAAKEEPLSAPELTSNKSTEQETSADH
jgi:hypothetical protein